MYMRRKNKKCRKEINYTITERYHRWVAILNIIATQKTYGNLELIYLDYDLI